MACKLTVKKILAILGLILVSSGVLAEYSSNFDPVVGDRIEIIFEGNDEVIFDDELKKITSRPGNIRQSEKKEFNVKIKSNYASSNNCKGKIKVNGDWQDHIDIKNLIASLNVELVDECYIGGLNKFKLLLPHTRNGDNEIFWSLLLDHYGFPTLYTKNINVALGRKKFSAIFQEKPTSYFLERHGIRETPILEQDERNFWATYASWFEKVEEKGELTEADVWAPLGKRLTDNSATPLESDVSYGRLVNREFLGKDSNIPVVMSALNEYRNPNKYVLNNVFYQSINKRFAPHASGNQSYIYLPLINGFLPLYYDGNVDLFPSAVCDVDGEIIIPDKFIEEYKLRSGSDLHEDMRCVFGKVEKMSAKSKWFDLETYKEQVPIKYADVGIGTLRTGIEKIKNPYVYSLGGRYYEVDPNSDKSKEIDIDRLRKVLKGKSVKRIKGYNIPIVALGEINGKVNTRLVDVTNSTDSDYIVNNEILYILSQLKGHRIFKVKLTGIDAKVVFIGEYGADDEIYVSGSSENSIKDSRHDPIMLTGCATFFNSFFESTRLNSSASGCEDSINLLGARGFVSDISISGASEDALDADFSDVRIGNVNIFNAGNDCIDLSTGKYEITNSNLKNCSDKAISIGENSNVYIGHTNINNASKGVVVKDGSSVTIERITTLGVKNSCVLKETKKTRYTNPYSKVKESNCQ